MARRFESFTWRMYEIVEVFRERLKENGIEATVSTGSGTKIYVQGSMNGEDFYWNYNFTPTELSDPNQSSQIAAQLADEFSRNLKEDYKESIDWGYNAVRFDFNGKHEVNCLRCGASVIAEEVLRRASYPISAESTVPQSPPMSVDSLHPQKLRMFLLAQLRGECDSLCENSPDDRKF